MDKKDSSILNVTIQDTKYRVDGNAVYCDMIVKVNLDSFEQQYFQFTPKFVKKVIGEHLPIVKSITNYCYSDVHPLVAKYYIVPGGGAKVLAFDKNYYKKCRKLDNEKLLNVGDVIPVKQIIKTDCECETYDYCQTFTITGKAVCLPEDEFNLEKGKFLASCKAAEKVSKRVSRLYHAIWNRAGAAFKAVETEYKNSLTWIDNSSKIIKEIAQ